MTVYKKPHFTIGKRGVEYDLSHIVESVAVEEDGEDIEVRVKDDVNVERHVKGLEKSK